MRHYFDASPETAHEEKFLNMRLRGHDFRFKTDRQVFSRHAVDYGTQLLIETVLDDEKLYGRMLDLGCGYGPVGIISKRLAPHLDLVMSDVNKRAVSLAKENLKLNQIKYVQVIVSDGLQHIEGSFNVISLNPPVRAGKQVVYRLFEDAFAHLAKNGYLYVVIQKKQGALSAQKALETITPHVERINRSAGYWVLRAEKTE